MNFFLANIIKKVKDSPFFYILLGLVFIIFFTSLKPGYALLGWDNYSSFLNPSINIVRMFLDPWREFRGLGVPSDSESTDIFRQFWFFIFSPFVSKNLLEQLYFLCAMAVGVLATYSFTSRIIDRHSGSERYADIGGFVAGFFYLFNLNTLSIFYFPITPYISRFFTIPVLLIVFDTIFHTKKLSPKQYLLILFAVFFTAPSYVIGTVLVTTVMLLGLFSIFQEKFQKVFVVMLFFGLLNAFWLLPFLNYTVQKSKIIRLAPTFISANETQLNKPKTFYGLKKQLILWPNFFETQVTSLKVDKSADLHPMSKSMNTFVGYMIFGIFPLLYVLGSIAILIHPKKNWKLLWIPSVIALFTFLSMKEYSIFGFFYAFLGEYVPYFSVIFRFGDTKFHPYIAFAGAVSAAYAVVFLGSRLEHIKAQISLKVVSSLCLLVSIGTVILFRPYLTGKFIGFYMYNKIPGAYNEISTIINSDPEELRVVHLPYDDEVYWRSYSWGYVGSSFLYYMLDKPLFEKTFEPASMENAYVNERIQTLLHNSQSLNGEDIEDRSAEFYSLLSKLGVKYVIFDETVSTAQPSRGMNLWARFNTEEARYVLSNLEDRQLIRRAYVGNVSMKEYMNYYEKLFWIDDSVRKEIVDSPAQQIILYELKDRAPKVSLVSDVTYIDPQFDQELLVKDLASDTMTVQGANKYLTYPFYRKDGKMTQTDTGLQMNLNNFKSGKHTIQGDEKPSLQTHLLKMTGKIEGNNLVIRPYIQHFPTINNHEFTTALEEITIPLEKIEESLRRETDVNEFLADWNLSGHKKLTDLRLQINNTTVPVPQLDTQERLIGYTLIESDNFDISVLQRDSEYEISPYEVGFTEKQNCYNDALEGYNGTLSQKNGMTTIKSQNGSTCFWLDMQKFIRTTKAHIELRMDITSKQKNLDYNYLAASNFTSKPKVTSFVKSREKPSSFEVCMRESTTDNCYNSSKLFNLRVGKSTIRIPAARSTQDVPNLLAFFALKNTQYQSQQLDIQSLAIDTYESVIQKEYSLDDVTNPVAEIEIDEPILKIDIPYTYGQGGYRFNQPTDAFYTSTDPCRDENTYRTFRISDEKYISYAEDCQNRLFAQIPFSSNNFYVWSVDYNLASGQYPRFVLKDGLYRYKDELMSQYQGYPDVDGFKEYQNPEMAFQGNIKSLAELPIKNTYTYIYPEPEYTDEKNKEFLLQQYSESESLMMIQNFDVVALPNSWQSLVLKPEEGATARFMSEGELKYRSILPSLKVVTIQSDKTSKEDYMFMFNEGYDAQWGVYSSVLNAILGNRIEKDHMRCNGYANCYRLGSDVIDTNKPLYVYYWPQTLSFIGWGMVFLTIGGLGFYVYVLRTRKSAS